MREEDSELIDLGSAQDAINGKVNSRRSDPFEIKTWDWNGNEIPDKPIKLARPPATGLVSLLKFVLTAAAYNRMVAAYVSQEQHAYYEALQRHDSRQARWIQIRMYVLLVGITCRAFISPVIRLITRVG